MSKLRRRVGEAAEAALAQRKYVSAVDVFTGLGWVRSRQVERWRQGQAESLEQVAAVDGRRMRDAAELLGEWARERGLTASTAVYLSGGRDREALRFVDDGGDEVFRVHWLSAELSPARREQVIRRQNKAPDLTVVEAAEPWQCVECAETGPYLIASAAGPLCPACSDLDHLEFLPAGNAALSRRAKKESTLAAVVVRFNRRRKRYERLGILVEEAALARAEEQCLADEEARARRRERDRVRRAEQDVEFCARMAAEIRRLFPRCPADRATEIAAHAAVRGSGRVGRTAAAKLLSPEALTLAVIASIRHRDTDYDHLLMRGVSRMQARAQIRPRLDEVLNSWRA
ncbi:DUF2293 domain-containing protein [Nocardia sp. CDC159]|uniref:DUF2293 domain-containing protein n=1 Tax=Nocardia pulmonis TaxID=2951408 RepID=A0A9X2E9J8_9NOCA|nr:MULTISPECIES: DUF2293 domain-containing protein [Nocardia]MCM6774028.1 DUF2293 domain-containing protein [Nocardia pulmonis]MCM6786915.1 DUF2293 domain-containing protein [Nocardia sp. CDC159]